MAYVTENAQLNDRPLIAGILSVLREILTPKSRLPRDLSDHIARDIGLSEHDLEALRHEWPSERPDSPRI